MLACTEYIATFMQWPMWPQMYYAMYNIVHRSPQFSMYHAMCT